MVPRRSWEEEERLVCIIALLMQAVVNNVHGLRHNPLTYAAV